ncbi:MAG TPA: AAA family ATPase [Acidothermaceae bacterium]|nr:AAA family ATPase [Acidothermaceae bacterium]
MSVIVESDPTRAETLRSALGPGVAVLATIDDLRRHLDAHPAEDAVVLGPSVDQETAFVLSDGMRIARPSLGIVLVRRRIDTPLLVDALRAGVREVVEERNLAGVNDAVKRVRDVAAAMRQRTNHGEGGDDAGRGVVVTVFSAKGGCGKTTLASNLAASLADGGRRDVCLVDLDLNFGDVAIVLQLFPAHTLADAVPLIETLDLPAVTALLTPHSPGLSALVAPVEPGSAETVPASLITTIIQLLRDQFAYVIIDTPPAFTDHVLAAFDQSDLIALLATLDIPALKNLKLTLETLDLLNYPRERLRVVLNRADSKVGLALSEVEKTLKVPIALHIPSSRAVPASINRGVPILLDDPNHPVSLVIRHFGEEHVLPLARAGAEPIPSNLRADRRGLLRRRSKA